MSQTKDKLVRDQPVEMPSQAGPLARYKGERPAAPGWFESAVATPYETEWVVVRGARIHYQRWGRNDRPGLLFVHGNGAHAHWWDFVAPYFAASYNVAALTFSGMGDSDRRDSYDMQTFAEEQIAVCEAAGMFSHETRPIIVAHSFGGFATLLTGAEYGDRLHGTVIVDSPVNPPDHKRGGPPRGERPNKIYPDLTAALARFRLAPPQPCDNDYAMDYIARWSLMKVQDADGREGWTWKFDPRIWRHFDLGRPASELLQETKCRIAIFRGENSALMPDDVGEYMQELLNRQVPFISIPQAHHHVMLDQPLAFVAALRTLLAEWDHSVSNRAITEGQDR